MSTLGKIKTNDLLHADIGQNFFIRNSQRTGVEASSYPPERVRWGCHRGRNLILLSISEAKIWTWWIWQTKINSPFCIETWWGYGGFLLRQGSCVLSWFYVPEINLRFIAMGDLPPIGYLFILILSVWCWTLRYYIRIGYIWSQELGKLSSIR